jgi:hypothetical protein
MESKRPALICDRRGQFPTIQFPKIAREYGLQTAFLRISSRYWRRTEEIDLNAQQGALARTGARDGS